MNRRKAIETLAGAAVLAPFLGRCLGASNADSGSAAPGPPSLKSLEAGGIQMMAGGKEVPVYHTAAGNFGSFTAVGAEEISISFSSPIKSVRISPRRHAIRAVVDGSMLRFSIPGPLHLAIEVKGQPQLFLFADPPEVDRPKPGDPGVRFFAAGKTYEVGELRLQSNDYLYIEAGAVVRGCICATSAKNLRIGGRGILDGSYFSGGMGKRRAILLEDCEDSRVEDLVLIEPTSWMLVLGACRRMTVSNVKLLGFVMSSDGCDIVGCQKIRVENCFFRNGDDCVVVKSLDLRRFDSSVKLDHTRNVEDIEVVGCAFMTNLGGQAMEIGHELRCDFVRNVRFHDCDVIAVTEFGAPFGIHNADHATVEDVVFEDIRVDNYYDKLVDFRIVRTRWSRDKERGQVRNVVLRDIAVAVAEYNVGYTVSIIGGFDQRHTIENVRFENFHLDPILNDASFASFENPARKVLSADDLDLYVRYAANIEFA